jgi:ankyrin repeat protein
MRKTSFPAAFAMSILAFAICLFPGCYSKERPTGVDRWRPKDFYSDPEMLALIDAVDQGNLTEIDRLIADGANVNAIGKDGMTPLLWARCKKNKASFLRLLEKGADPNIPIKDGSSVMSMTAASPQDIYWLETVLQHGGNPNLVHRSSRSTPLFDAVSSRKKENLQLIIKAGADLNWRQYDGDTAMLDAARVNWFDSVYYLLEAGADYRIKGDLNCDLAELTVTACPDPQHELNKWRKKVARFLEQKGIDLKPLKEKELALRKKQAERWKSRGRPVPEGYLDLGLDGDEEPSKEGR